MVEWVLKRSPKNELNHELNKQKYSSFSIKSRTTDHNIKISSV